MNNVDLFDLKKELAQSKIIINLDEINEDRNKNKFLKSRIWESLEDLKIKELDDKVESIYRGMNQESIKKLKEDIDKKSLEDYFKNYELVASTYPIGCLNTLKFMVDTTFMNESVYNDIIKSDIEELTPYIFKFRSINGDGDCFYRSLIFSFLENIIFNNKIMQMKELLILYHEKINKDNKLISQKEYLTKINELNISIVSEILYIIINQLETDISKAYIILLKAFLFCDGFDSSIIFFTRYLFYEFISSNENKLYSKEWQVEIGCLLPDLFIIDRGDKNEYKFEEYYSTHLMHPKVYAEKIDIYIAPFVFNIRMNVLIYNFGDNFKKSFIKEKEFFNENGGENIFQAQINLLYRKIHYDVYYKFDEYDDFQKYFDIFNNRFEEENNFIDAQGIHGEEDLNKKIIQTNPDKNNAQINNNLGNKSNNSAPNKNDNENKINNPQENKNEIKMNNEIQNNVNNNEINISQENNNKKQYDFNDNEIHLNDNKNLNNDLNNKNDNKDINKNNINKNNKNNNKKNLGFNENKIIINLDNNSINNIQQKCLECKKNHVKEANPFNLCDECLKYNLKSEVGLAFLEFLKDMTNLVNSEEKFNYLIKQKKCQKQTLNNFTINDAIKSSKYELNKILLDVRSHMCLFCAQEIPDNEDCFIELPCKCKLCTENCFLRYLKKIGAHITLKDVKVYFKHIALLSCFCGFIYNTQNILYMIKRLEARDLDEEKEVYQNYLLNLWNWRCCLCKDNFEPGKEFVKATFDCEDIDKNLLNKKTEFKHLMCDLCFSKFSIKKGINISCKICDLNHKINSLIKVNQKNEEQFLIIQDK